MNYFGSYRRLLANSKSAMLAAIEIYNKPRFDYRDEVFVIVLLNAWELLIKALLSRNRRSIYYRKVRNQPYRTLSWRDGMIRARNKGAWPRAINPEAVEANLDRLTVYRDAAVHFYNAPGFGIVIYSLAQTSIMNYKDVLAETFGQDLSSEINWQLLPLGLEPPLSPVEYLKGPRHGDGKEAVDEFLSDLLDLASELESKGNGTSRLMTLFTVGMQSTKDLKRADIVIGVDGNVGGGDPVYVERRVDPRKSHPLFMKDVLEAVGEFHGRKFNRYDFQAVVYHYNLREEDRWCYQDVDRNYVRWSGELPSFIMKLSADDINSARKAYGARSK